MKDVLDIEKEKELLGKIRSRREASRKSKNKRANEMKIDLLYYLGEQFSYLSEGDRELVRITDMDVGNLYRDNNVMLYKVNKIKPAVNTIVAKGTQKQPKMAISTTANDQRVKDVAKGGTKFLAAYRVKKDVISKSLRNYLWMVVTGKSYMWAHPKLEFAGDKPSVDITITHLNPLQVYGPPGIIDIDEWPWLIIDRMVGFEDIKDMYPDADLQTDDDYGGVGGVGAGDESQADFTSITTEEIFRSKLIIEYFEKPTRDNHRGRHCVICEDVVLHDDEFPYWNKDKNGEFTKCAGYRIVSYDFNDGLVSHWSTGAIRDAQGIQKTINVLWSAILTNRIKTMGLKIYVRQGYKGGDREFDNTPGVEYLPLGADMPAWRGMPVLPPDAFECLSRMYVDLEEVMGIHRLSQGNEPDQRLPAIAILNLVELDNSKFQPIFDRYEASEQKLYTALLQSYQQFCPRAAISFMNPKDQPETAELMMDDLDDFEIKLERMSSMPDSKAGQVGILINTLQYGGGDLLMDPAEKRKFMLALNQGWAEQWVEDETASIELARQENRKMKEPDPITGEPTIPPVSEFHNHLLHIGEHLADFETPEYWLWAGTPFEDARKMHIRRHQMLLALQQQAAQESMDVNQRQAESLKKANSPTERRKPGESTQAES